MVNWKTCIFFPHSENFPATSLARMLFVPSLPTSQIQMWCVAQMCLQWLPLSKINSWGFTKSVVYSWTRSNAFPIYCSDVKIEWNFLERPRVRFSVWPSLLSSLASKEKHHSQDGAWSRHFFRFHPSHKKSCFLKDKSNKRSSNFTACHVHNYLNKLQLLYKRTGKCRDLAISFKDES